MKKGDEAEIRILRANHYLGRARRKKAWYNMRPEKWNLVRNRNPP